MTRAIVLAAGKGTRMKSERPKVLHEVFGRPLLGYVLDRLRELGTEEAVVVIGSGAEQVKAFLAGEKSGGMRIRIAYQREQKGTGHAVEMTRAVLRGFRGDVLIWPGDMPLLKKETLKRFSLEHRRAGSLVSVLSALRVDAQGYGRILRTAGRFSAIREELDATEDERRIQEVNTGVYFFQSEALFSALKRIKPANVKGEFYLTDTIEILDREEKKIEAFPLASASEGLGINSRRELAEATRVIQNREVERLMEEGVTFVAPDQTFVEPGVRIGRDSVIYPWCYIEAGVKIGERCQIGPFAKIRKGSVIGDEAVVGSFVEVNRSMLGRGVLAKHLTYLGDAVIGDGCNVGAGVITANFDGKKKHKTRIGKNVLIGANTVLVAPVVVEDGARTGAGSVVTARMRVKKGTVVVGVPARPLGRR